MYLKSVGGMANSVDPDQRPCSAASDLGLHCLLMPVHPNTWGKYSLIVILKFVLVGLKLGIFICYNSIKIQNRSKWFKLKEVVLFFLFVVVVVYYHLH